MRKKISAILLSLGVMVEVNAHSFVAMSDQQLSDTVGQALMSLTYIAPTDAANLETDRLGGAKNIGFYKLGLEAELELNANIKKLQLGCGGVNGAGACDIDIDYLSLSGISDTSNGRVSSSAKLTNPFMEFAIKNPSSAATREVVGLRVSSEKAIGMISFGLENSETPTGINSLSGYMDVQATTGTAKVNGYDSNNPLTQIYTGVAIKGQACGLLCLGFSTTAYNLNLLSAKTGSKTLLGALTLPQQTITGKRITSANLKASATVEDIAISGNIAANASGIKLDKNTAGLIKNLTVDVTINEGLKYFHKADLNGTSASLSLQSQDIKWTNTKSVAQNGWWLEFSNPIDIGDISPEKAVDIALPTLKETLAQVNDYLATDAGKISCGAGGLLGCVFGSAIAVGTVDLKNGTPVSMDLTNMVLKNQNFAPNCYGGLKFC
ncbi:hypothetical protein [Acinetobacter sp. ANC 4648]|uniref:hypothetical protein n=1 Tax=Acinetobacter sp. ANC 4648 TaxID=1977875 RepID=UPI00148AC839